MLPILPIVYYAAAGLTSFTVGFFSGRWYQSHTEEQKKTEKKVTIDRVEKIRKVPAAKRTVSHA